MHLLICPSVCILTCIVMCPAGLCVPAVMLAIVGYVGCNSAAAMTILCIGTFSNGATVSGYVANQHDIAPNFAGRRGFLVNGRIMGIFVVFVCIYMN